MAESSEGNRILDNSYANNDLKQILGIDLKKDYPGIQIRKAGESKGTQYIINYNGKEVVLSGFFGQESLSTIREKFGAPKNNEQIQDTGFSMNKISYAAKSAMESAGIPIRQSKGPDGRFTIQLGGESFKISSLEMNLPFEKDGSLIIANSRSMDYTGKDGNKDIFTLTLKEGNKIRVLFEPKQKTNNTISNNPRIENTQQQGLSFMKNPDGSPNYTGTLDNISTISLYLQQGNRLSPQDWQTLNIAMLQGRHGKQLGFNRVESINLSQDGGLQVVLGKYGLTFPETQQKGELVKDWYSATKKGDIPLATNLQNKIDELNRPKQKSLYINNMNWRSIL